MSNIESAAETMHRRQQQDLIELRAEVERLHADLEGRESVCDSYAAENQLFHDEIERLRAELAVERAKLIAELERLKAENEKLKVVLYPEGWEPS